MSVDTRLSAVTNTNIFWAADLILLSCLWLVVNSYCDSNFPATLSVCFNLSHICANGTDFIFIFLLQGFHFLTNSENDNPDVFFSNRSHGSKQQQVLASQPKVQCFWVFLAQTFIASPPPSFSPGKLKLTSRRQIRAVETLNERPTLGWRRGYKSHTLTSTRPGTHTLPSGCHQLAYATWQLSVTERKRARRAGKRTTVQSRFVPKVSEAN